MSNDLRRWMNVCEAKAPKLVELFRQFAWAAFEDNLAENESELTDYVSDYEDETGQEVRIPPKHRMERGGELLDPAFAQWCRAKVQERADGLADEIANVTSDGTLTCWRAVEAPPGWTPKRHIGIHWSRTPDKAQPIFALMKPGNHIYRVQARMPLSSIDWRRTMKANLSEEFGVDEDEITLKSRAPYAIVSVEQIEHVRESQSVVKT